MKNLICKIGDVVSFECMGTIKRGIISVIDTHGTWESPNILSYDIYCEEENMLYKHVRYNCLVN